MRMIDSLEPVAVRLWDTSGQASTTAQSETAISMIANLSLALNVKRIADTLDSVLTNGTSDDIYGLAIRTSDTPGR